MASTGSRSGGTDDREPPTILTRVPFDGARVLVSAGVQTRARSCSPNETDPRITGPLSELSSVASTIRHPYLTLVDDDNGRLDKTSLLASCDTGGS